MNQSVHAENGFAYGVVGADIHVFGDGVPVYLLQRWQPLATPDDAFLRDVPSRMLNARFRVVEFTGRAAELSSLQAWRDEAGALAVRWLHAPGGQGKTRLAERFAQASLADGWQVVTATHGPGSVLPPPGSQDLADGGETGVLLIVDYADRWPLSHLLWLFSNALLHGDSGRPARVLLLARGDDLWPGVRAALVNQGARTSSQRLAPLSGEENASGGASPAADEGASGSPRAQMFTVARDSFAARYDAAAAGITTAGITAPALLGEAEFGLTLAVHMAALVAVDAAVHGVRPPEDLAGLSTYLLDREQLHWARLHGDADHVIAPDATAFRTPPHVMNRTVFTAALTGAVAPDAGRAAIEPLTVHAPAGQLLTDHAVCYPAAEPGQGTVLEPLYPDRLCEDFLALTLPGHQADYPEQQWAGEIVNGLLREADVFGGPLEADWTARAMVFLAAAAVRWPHVGPAHLFPLLSGVPQLAVIGGSATLAALAELEDIDPDLLEAVAMFFPPFQRPSPDLDPGIAAVSTRLLPHRLERARSLNDRAVTRHEHGVRLTHAGRFEEALAEATTNVSELREAVLRMPRTPQRRIVEANLAMGLNTYAKRLDETGRRAEARAATEEAVALKRELAAADGMFLPDLASGLLGHSRDLLQSGHAADAAVALEECVGLYRGLVVSDARAHESDLAASLAALGMCYQHTGRSHESLALAREGVAVRRRLAAKDPSGHAQTLAIELQQLARSLEAVGSPDAVPTAQEAVDLYRELVRVNPAAYERSLADGLIGLAGRLVVRRRAEESLTAVQEGVAILRRVTAQRPGVERYTLGEALSMKVATLLGLAIASNNDGRSEEAAQWHTEAVAATHENVALYGELTATDPAAFAYHVSALLLAVYVRIMDTDLLEDAVGLFDRATDLISSGHAPLDRGMTYHEIGTSLADQLAAQNHPDEAARIRRLLMRRP
ncbi:tetratricopeptide repeat protein [Streptomyces sp. VRA16 Mangrove soil]|uniref:tetratricopeptide repeat protein n=1 Tax=Streptomyces sp. VRA16 Mangrove soil TaxID=2817434 RepID=UPI001A9F6757|nr:tetratricopeptide repeat protein [Streptomyces sp. VRA16 Mangrove soil]MBO1329891.1 tetratricopeptide repeat protein [Streptomyces sp. VRA16 Mangrove soil]